MSDPIKDNPFLPCHRLDQQTSAGEAAERVDDLRVPVDMTISFDDVRAVLDKLWAGQVPDEPGLKLSRMNEEYLLNGHRLAELDDHSEEVGLIRKAQKRVREHERKMAEEAAIRNNPFLPRS